MPARPNRTTSKYSQQGAGAFKEYRRRTGERPTLSIALYAGRFLLMFAGITLILWYGRSHPDSLAQTALYFLLIMVPITIAWSVGETLAWNHDLRRKGLSSKGKLYGARQLPPE